MKSLSELQSSPDVGLAERTVKICLSAKLAAELEQVKADLFEVQALIEQVKAERSEDAPQKPKRMGDTGPLADLEAKADDLAKQGDALRERIDENSVEVLLRGKSSGEWRQWAMKHPARDEDEDRQGAERDRRWAGGLCNVDALVDDLRLFVASYNGEEPSDAWATFVAEKGVPANLTLAASYVVGMHEQVVDAGKSLADWLADRRNVSG